MSEIVRLTLISHAITEALAAGRRPRDESLSPPGQRQVDATTDLGAVGAAMCAPEKRTRQRIGVNPVSRTVLHLRGQAWTLRSTG